MTTRNRADVIAQTLQCLAEQLTDEVELVVVDGASTDGTADVVSEIASRHEGMRLVRLTVNGGVDRDYDRAVIEAFGTYAWLMTDDDVVETGTVDRLLAACRQGHDLIVLNAAVYGPDLVRRLDQGRLRFPGDRIYQPGDPALLSELGDHLTFIGGVVIRRELWLSRNREAYYGSLFIHVGVIFQLPLTGTTLAIGEPLIRIRYGLGGWVSRRFEVWMVLWPRLVWSFEAYPVKVRSTVCPRQPWRSMRRLALFRAQAAYGLAEYGKFIAPHAGLVMRSAAIAIAVVPGAVWNLLGVLLTHLRGQSTGTGMLDLRASRFHWRRILPWR